MPAEVINQQNEVVSSIWKRVLGINDVTDQDDFFDSGGNSLLALKLISVIQHETGIELTFPEIFSCPTLGQIKKMVEKKIHNSPFQKQTGYPELHTDRFPLSLSQERIWFMDKTDGSTQYHIPVAFELRGNPDSVALNDAFRQLCRKHATLRTLIKEENGVPYQYVRDEDFAGISVIGNLTEEERRNYFMTAISSPFYLDKDYPLRVHLIPNGPEIWILLIVFHHIAIDGWSLGIIYRDLSAFYNNRQNISLGQTAALTAFATIAAQERESTNEADSERHIRFWKDTLLGAGQTELPADFPRPLTASAKGATVLFTINEKVLEGLKHTAKKEGASLFMTLLSCFYTFIYRYTGLTDMCVGTPVSGNRTEVTKDIVGFFSNIIPLRTELSPVESFTDLIQRTKNTCIDAIEHQHIGFGQIVTIADWKRDPSRHPLFQLLFSLENHVTDSTLTLNGLEVAAYPLEIDFTQVDLSLYAREVNNSLHFSLGYSTSLFREDTITRMIQHFTFLLESLSNNPSQMISKTRLMSPQDERLLAYSFNPDRLLNADATITALFEQTVQKVPDRIAVDFLFGSYTYAELNKNANKLAQFLINRGFSRGSCIAVCMQRSGNAITAILGILKAGCAYVPVDPGYPDERKKYMFAQSESKLVITDYSLKGEDAFTEIQEACIEDVMSYADECTDNPMVAILPQDTAYIIFTSGTTGSPKGTMISHNNVTSLFLATSEKFSFSPSDIFSVFHSFSFDFSVWEIFGALFHGAEMVIVPENIARDSRGFAELIQKKKITVLSQTPQSFYALSSFLLSSTRASFLRYIVFGGESLNLQKLSAWFTAYGDSCKLVNMYGITETTVHVTFQEIKEEHTQFSYSLAGKPLSFLNVVLLDKDGAVVPPGVEGEIHVNGNGVSKGYLNNKVLTAEKFIYLPSFLQPGKWYRSGDTGKWLPDGSLIVLGRTDDQVKIRGYRIETGEVEATILMHQGIEQVSVLALEASGTRHLVAFLVCKDEHVIKEFEVREFLASKLPAFMIPSWFYYLSSIPRTGNGKIDKKELAAVFKKKRGNIKADFIPPVDSTEIRLAGIWENLLMTSSVGANSNFFEMGGHSLLITRLCVEIATSFGVKISIREIFNNPVLHMQAKLIRKSELLSSVTDIMDFESQKKHSLTFTQERLWFIDQLEGSVKYHVPYIVRIKGNLELQAMEFAFCTLAERHLILKTLFREEGGRVSQFPNADRPLDFQVIQIEQPAETWLLDTYKRDILDQPFILAEDPPLRIRLLRLAADEYILFIVMHHIVTDGWSYKLLLSEIRNNYIQFTNKNLDLAQPLPFQFGQYADWLRHTISGESLEQSLQYWKKKLEGIQPYEFPRDYANTPVQSGRGAFLTLELDVEERLQLEKLGRSNNSTLFMTMMGAFGLLLYRYGQQNDICIGTPVDGRNVSGTSKLIGCFINTIVLRIEFDGDMTFMDLLEQLRNTVMEAIEHQDVPFEKVVEATVREREMSKTPLFQVMFSMENIEKQDMLDLPEVTITPEPIEITTTQFELNMYVRNEPDKTMLIISYSTDLFKGATIKRLLHNYRQLLGNICRFPDKKISAIDLLAAEERKELLYEFNNTQKPYSYTTLHQLFTKRATESKENIALRFKEKDLSYRKLNQWSDKIARLLINAGIQPGESAALMTARGFDMVAGMLGILKAGGSYVPVDPAYPEDRQAYILKQSDVSYIVCDKQYTICEEVVVKKVILTSDIIYDKGSDGGIAVPVSPAQLAYTIYTSGSTGLPKGVMISHHAAVNLIEWVNKTFSVGKDDRLLFITSMCFDLSVYDIFGMLAAGGTIVIASEEDVYDPDILKRLLTEERITFWDSVPSTLNYLVSELRKTDPRYIQTELRLVFLSGDWIPLTLPQQINTHFTSAKVISLGGATEGTVWSNFYIVKKVKSEWKSIPYGKPITNNFFYILDKYLQPVPWGATGDLYIGGVGVANGYANDPEKTNAAFLMDPFNSDLGGRMYKTGDSGRMMEDGNMEFCGRSDDQVKIRGFRVELGEIDHVLMKSGLISQSVTILNKDDRGVQQLITYVVGADETQAVSKDFLMEFCSRWLPQYMIPHAIIPLRELPLTTNGKIDKKALAAMVPEPQDSMTVAGQTLVARKLADIWGRVLGKPVINADDNFFELGGHSLVASRLIAEIKQELNTVLTLRDIFQHTVFCKMVRLIEMKTGNAIIMLEKAPWSEQFPLTEAQKGIWTEEQFSGPEACLFNITDRIFFEPDVEDSVLIKAIGILHARHELLRCSVQFNGYEPVFVLSEDFVPDISIQNTSEDKDFAELVAAEIGKASTMAFSLENGPLIKFILLKGVRLSAVIISVHHIIIDLWSLQIIKKEINFIYSQLLQGQLEVKKEPVYWQFRDYSVLMKKTPFESHREYWASVFSGKLVPRLQLSGQTRPPFRTYDAEVLVTWLDSAVFCQLKKAALELNTTIFCILLASVHCLLARKSGEQIITTGVPSSGRDTPELQDMIGYFLNTVVISAEISPQDTFSGFVAKIKDVLGNAVEHHQYPFNKLVHELYFDRDPSRHPVFDVMVSYEQHDDLSYAGPAAQAESWMSGWKVKYDLLITFSGDTDLKMMLIYNSCLFSTDEIKSLKEELFYLIGKVIADTDTLVSKIFDTEVRSMLIPKKTPFSDDDFA
jgi:amino acid adenylation domain-containing protein